MTATTVDGKKVIATEPLQTPLSTPETPIYYKRIVLLLLDDGNTTYGCNLCDYTNKMLGSARSHLRAHAGPKSTTPHPGSDPFYVHSRGLSGFTLAELVELATRQLQADEDTSVLDKLRADRDEWKARAREAEKKLAAGQKALKAMMGES